MKYRYVNDNNDINDNRNDKTSKFLFPINFVSLRFMVISISSENCTKIVFKKCLLELRGGGHVHVYICNDFYLTS